MILRRVEAQGFMRYERLEIGPLPARGIIAVLGPNESGKSTIGEAVAFALFGRSVKSELSDVSQLVSWDAERARVLLELDVAGEGVWIFEREVDKRGDQRAVVRGANGVTLAEGEQEVAAFVRDRLGLDFETFRASVYLAQDDLRALREQIQMGADPAADTSARVMEEIFGIATLERAAAGIKRTLPEREALERALEQELAVTRALLETYEVDPDEQQAACTERDRLEVRLAEIETRLAELGRRRQRLLKAIAARSAIGEAFGRFERAVLGRRSRLVREEAARRLAGLEASLRRALEQTEAKLAEAKRLVETSRNEIDRLIAYQAQMAELEARLQLYAAEVRRRLSAPEVSEDDLVALEGLAMPATPAAALRLGEVRVARLRRARNRSLMRASIFAALALISLLFGVPALVKVLPPDETAPPTGIDQTVAALVDTLADAGISEPGRIWVGFAVGGSVGGVLFGVLSVLGFRQARVRHESLLLAEEGRKRLESEVRELEQELETLQDIDLRRPREATAAIERLRNEGIRKAFAALKKEFARQLEEPVSRNELMGRERAVEEHRRRELERLTERRLRLMQLLERIPEIEGSTRLESQASHASEDLESLDALEREIAEQTERYRRANARLTELERLDEEADPRGRLAALRAELEAVAAALEPERAERIVQFGARPELDRIAAGGSKTDVEALEAELEALASELEKRLPPAERLLSERDAVVNEIEELEQEREQVRARLATVSVRASTLERRRSRFDEAKGREAELEAQLEPLKHEIAVRTLARELLEETANDLRRRLGPMLSRFVSAVLPWITAGRYRRVRVLSNLDVRVYSPEKNDFVPLLDLSAGTADQLLLVLRLGVAAALGRSKGLADPRSFLFLDEPLASFDRERAAAFLDLLEALSDVFPQVFLIAHVPVSVFEDRFRWVISTEVGRRRLIVSAPAAGGEEAEVAQAGPEEPREPTPRAERHVEAGSSPSALLQDEAAL